ncbi:O-methyltransferase [Olivibacter domesticus]|uniref:Predicted O-methyltransferase YrrM n=1 Tax=Olivibacter domesticus TaxID=407022 RepID=A0A1H7W2A9_OLID1|nr:class I SAM-dependent methyltransferase [Olivibacter domesticus]SEM15660.1 Predicted O-methyltransferase YrrM [Olivibacter domesticus]
MKTIFQIKSVLLLILFFGLVTASTAQSTNQKQLDERVQKFLNENRQKWHSLNVPYEDGQVLHDLIVNNNYKSALEIGTSTGHSTIWIAWALSKTGGKLTTIEIDMNRQKEAIKNLEMLGLSNFVSFKHGDAHQIVKSLDGPFDFVFSDADKDWYIQYFKDLDPKLQKGGRFTAHNVLQNMSGIRAYMDYVKSRPDYETIINKSSSSGIAISRKK